MQQRAHRKSLRQHLPVGCLSRTCFPPPIRLSCCIVSHPVALYCKDSLHFVNGLFKSDKAEEEEAYVPDVWSFLSLSTRSSRSRSTSLIVAAILYKRSSCIGCRVIQRQTHTRNRQQQSRNTVKLRCGKVGGQRRKRKAALENLKEATETCTEPQGDIKRFNEAHEPRVTVRRNLLWGITLRSVSAEGQEEGELTCVPPCISSSSSNPNTLPPLWSFCPENLSKITFSTFFLLFFLLSSCGWILKWM